MNTEKEQKEIEEKWQTERLEKQIYFIREKDRRSLSGDRHIYPMESAKKMMPNTHGIWH